MRRTLSATRRFVRDLSGRSDETLVSRLLAQLDATLRGAELAIATVRGEQGTAAAREAMAEIEHDGDHARAFLIDRLATSLSTPIDREDLFRLSRDVDDILDTLRDFARELDLFCVSRTEVLEEPLEAVVTAVRGLTSAVEVIGQSPKRLPEAALTAKKNEIKPAYQVAMCEVLDKEPTAETLKLVELLRQLDHVGLRLDDAANALSDGAVKRGQ